MKPTLISVLAALLCTPLRSATNVTVTNPTAQKRPAETVSIAWPLNDVTTQDLRVIDTNGNAIPHQLFDSNGDGTTDQLLFTVRMNPNEIRTYRVVFDASIPCADTRSICFNRHVPERLDDVAWENDKTVFRVYGPAVALPPPKGEGLISSGVDVWCKNVSSNVINTRYKRGNYHTNHGDGMDFYKTGPAAGVGGYGILRDGTWYNSGNWQTYRHLCNGPIRTAFELTYNGWQIDGTQITETRRISLDAGTHFTRHESTITVKGGKPLVGGPAVDISTTRRHNGAILLDAQAGLLANAEPKQGKNGFICSGLIFPGGGNAITDSAGCLHFTRPLPQGTSTIVWYAGSAWSGDPTFARPTAWHAATKARADALSSPLRITVK